MTKTQVLEQTNLSNYMVTLITKRYSLGEVSGRCRVYSDKEVEFMKLVAHYRRHEKNIFRMYNLIKENQGITDKDLRKRMEVSAYRYRISLTELTYMCYLWEDSIKGGRTSYYIEGHFFEKYMVLFGSGKLDGDLTKGARSFDEKI